MNDVKETLKAISNDVAEIKTSQAVMQRDIAHHIRRTDLAEENIQAFRQEITPIKRHVSMIEGALKLIGALATAATLTAAVIKIAEAL